jgi:hypothetical protein
MTGPREVGNSQQVSHPSAMERKSTSESASAKCRSELASFRGRSVEADDGGAAFRLRGRRFFKLHLGGEIVVASERKSL